MPPNNPARQKETYSYQSAHAKIALLQNQGYRFIGDLPEAEEPWAMLKQAFFLFIKDAKHYQYQGKSLLSDLKSKIKVDQEQRASAAGFSRIMTNNYIYIICPHKTLDNNNMPKITLLLKENAAITGHDFLIAPYKKYAQEHEIIGGEIYYHNGELLLINRKSGSFRTNENKALTSISAILGPIGQAAYYHSVEEAEVQDELRKRTIAKTPLAVSSPKPAANYEKKSNIGVLQAQETPPIARRAWEVDGLLRTPSPPLLKYSPKIAPKPSQLEMDSPPRAQMALEISRAPQHRFFSNKSTAQSDTAQCPRPPCVIL